MKTRLFLVTALAVLAATGGLALSADYIEWFNGPAQFIMSKDEVMKWRGLRSDVEAKAFVELFWARRDPTPDTPHNEARDLFEARVQWADKNLRDGGKQRGAMTDRGRFFVLYGAPKRIERSAPERSSGEPYGGLQKDERISDNWVQWIYEGDDVKNIFLVPRVTIRFVDRIGNEEFKVERGAVDLAAAQTRAVTRMILTPELTVAPTYSTTRVAAPAAPAVAAPAPVMTTLSTAALATSVSEFKAAAKNPYENSAYATWGEYVTAAGEYYVPVMLYVPKGSGITADQNLTFFGVVEDESGKGVVAFEEPARLIAARDDVYVDKSLSLPAGKHRGIFGLARDGKPVVIASTDMTLAGSLNKDETAVSQLILANFVQAIETVTPPTEPFSFGGVKVVPKADKAFSTSDELWFFFAMRNPGLAEAIAPTEGSATGAPAEQKPKIQVKMDVEGKAADGKPIKRSAPPREVDAVPMKGVPGHYGIGNAIPLETFKPGDYKITLKVMDTVKKTSYTLTDTFKVVQ